MFDRTVITNLTGNSEATMNSAVSASVGMALLKLLEHYGVDNINIHYAQAFDEISTHALATEATSRYLQDKAQEAFSYDLDSIRLYTSKDSAARREFIRFNFSIKQVIWLVWQALTDDEKYLPLVESINEQIIKHADNNQEIVLETLLSHRQSRLESFFNCLERLKLHPVCHQGVRHELVFLLNQSFPGIQLIEDEKSALLVMVKDQVFSQYLAVYEKASNPEKTVLQSALVKWMQTASCEELFNLLDSEKIILTELETFYLSHGIKPQDVKLAVRLEEALKSLVFSCDPAKYPGAYTAYLILKDCKKLQNPEAQAALKAVKEMIKGQSDMNSPDFVAALELFYLLYQTFLQALIEKNLLIYSARLPDNYESMMAVISHYFTAVAEDKALPISLEKEKICIHPGFIDSP